MLAGLLIPAWSWRKGRRPRPAASFQTAITFSGVLFKFFVSLACRRVSSNRTATTMCLWLSRLKRSDIVPGALSLVKKYHMLPLSHLVNTTRSTSNAYYVKPLQLILSKAETWNKTMLTVHHLNNSRSQRILWLLVWRCVLLVRLLLFLNIANHLGRVKCTLRAQKTWENAR